jgi:short-subunit dehydrogenase
LKGTGVQATIIKPGAVTTPFFDTAATRDNGRRIPAVGLAISPERVAGRILKVIERPRRIVYVPWILRVVPFVELFFGWFIDLLGPLLLKRQPTGRIN